jgi:hypothetical protein
VFIFLLLIAPLTGQGRNFFLLWGMRSEAVFYSKFNLFLCFITRSCSNVLSVYCNVFRTRTLTVFMNIVHIDRGRQFRNRIGTRLVAGMFFKHFS